MKSLLNVSLYLKCFISHVAYLGKKLNSRYKYSGPFLSPKILRYAQNLQLVQNPIFPSREHIILNSLINS